MIAVYHQQPGRQRKRGARPGRSYLAALLIFLAVQVFVVAAYYRSLVTSRQRAAAEAKTTAAAATASGAQQPPPRRKYVSRREQERLLLQSTNYDEARVQRLRQAQQEAAAKLARGVAPPVQGTAIFPPGSADGQCVGTGPPAAGVVAAVVVVTYNRAKYLERMLESLFAVHGRNSANRRVPSGHKFPLFVSQDLNPPNAGNASGVQDVAAQHLDRLAFLQHVEAQPPVLPDKKEKPVYYRIANHYRFLLKTFFDCMGFERVLVLEDDMELALDSLTYFEAMAPILDRDDSLLCISAWNDHGQDRFVRNATQLYRSDFFPGLGWMLNRRVWLSIRDKWPAGYWDDFMRLNSTRAGRQCIRPEVSRTYNFGDIGSSSGQYFRLFLKPVKLNDEDVPWGQLDLSYLERGAYQRLFEAQLAAAQELRSVEEVAKAAPGRDYVLRYTSQQHYEQLTGRLRMLREWKDGVPRGAYHGVVAVRNALGARVFLAPTPEVDFSAAAFDPNVKVDATGAVIRRRPRAPRRQKAAQAAQHSQQGLQ